MGTEITNLENAFADFEGMAINYGSKSNADSDTCFTLGVICSMNKEESKSFMGYLLENWKEYALDVINGNYDYITITPMVYQAWENYM